MAEKGERVFVALICGLVALGLNLFRALTDLFVVPQAPLRGESDMMKVYREVRKIRTLHGDVFRPEAFRQLVLAARLVVEELAKTTRA